MKLTDISKNLGSQRDYKIIEKMGRLIATNPSYSNLDKENRKLIEDLLQKYKERMRKGITITRLMIKDDRSYLYSNRIKLGLSSVDLKQIFDLLESFKN